MAPPSPPAARAPAQAPPADSPSAPQASRGYAPPSAPPGANREPADAMPATYQQPAPRPGPAPRPSTARAAPARVPPPPPKAPPPKVPPHRVPPPPRGAPAVHAAQAAPVAPMLIYVGDYQMAVDGAELALTLDKVIDIAESLGGYLAGRKDTSVQVRIPSPRFRESLLLIGVRAEKNEPKGNLDFWADAVDRQLRRSGYVPEGTAADVRTSTGLHGRELKYTRQKSGRPYRMWIAVFVTEKRVWVVEAGGDADRFKEKQQKGIQKAIESVGVG